jgi:hypothetical protein
MSHPRAIGAKSRLALSVVLGRGKSLDELGRIDSEAASELEQVVEVEVALTTLDLAKEGPVHAYLAGHRLLAETELMAARTDALPKG